MFRPRKHQEAENKNQQLEDAAQVSHNVNDVVLFSLMLGSGIPQLQRKKDIIWLRQKLMPSLSEQEARREFRALIETSVKCERTQFNNFCVSYLLPLPSDPALSILVSPRPFPPFFVMVSPFHFTHSCHTHAPFLLFFSTH